MPNHERLYVDLIYKASNKWANYSPPRRIEVGEYGVIDKSSGEFIMHGNLYSPSFQKVLDAAGLDIDMSQYPVEVAEREAQFSICSVGAKKIEFGGGPESQIAGIVEVTAKGRWKLNHGKRDAVLVMSRPCMRYLPRQILLERLAKIPELKDKYLITEVYACHAYSLCISTKDEGEMSVALGASIPLPSFVPVSAGGGVELAWKVDGSCEFQRSAVNDKGVDGYYPLYTLKQIRKARSILFRDSPPPEYRGDDLWHDVYPPWEPLDDDGEEVPFIDDVQDFEDEEE